MRLRSATVDDAGAMERIAIAAIAASGYSPDQVEAWTSGFSEEVLRDVYASAFVIVMEMQGVVAGFATLVDSGETAGEMDLLYVSPDFKKRGVGKLLVRAIEDRVRQQGMTALWVDASEPAAHRLEQLGYRVHERHKKTVNGVVFHNTWMVKRFE